MTPHWMQHLKGLVLIWIGFVTIFEQFIIKI